MEQFEVSLRPAEAADMVRRYVLAEGISTKCIGQYNSMEPNGRQAVFLVFEKYFMRNSSRASLSIIIENLSGRTIVCSVGSGGGKGVIFGFDWGAADSFAHLAMEALKPYRV